MSKHAENNDESMDQEQPNLFIPLVMLALSVVIVMSFRLGDAAADRTQFQLTLREQEQQVAQVRKTSDVVEKIAIDLVALGKTDPVAKAIADRFGIVANPNVPGAPAFVAP